MGTIKKVLKTTKGNIDINTSRDRNASFAPELIKKRQKDVSDIEDKVISMYAIGISQREISDTIEDIYGFSISHELVSDITDTVIPKLEEWQQRSLEKCYPFLFVYCLYTKIRKDHEIKSYAVYTLLGYTLDGNKQILGLWLSQSESKHQWMQIFDEIKVWGVQDIFFISMDGVLGLESGVKAIFSQTIVQRCIVHLIRNSIKYVSSKDYKAFTASLKKVYAATSHKSCLTTFERYKQQWSHYPGAVNIWIKNFDHVEQLFNYGSNIMKIMYTTNSVESVHSSYRKVTRKGAFPNENALLKALFLGTEELEKKWHSGYIPN